MAAGDPDRAVVLHLVRLIQDSADVRYHVGGQCTRMRELLIEAVRASGFDGDPADALRPAPHREDEEPEILRCRRNSERLEDGLETIRRALACGDTVRAAAAVASLQAGEVA